MLERNYGQFLRALEVDGIGLDLLFKHVTREIWIPNVFFCLQDHRRRSQWPSRGLGLRPLAGWGFGFESRRGMNVCLL
jgi:hypothetical protein